MYKVSVTIPAAMTSLPPGLDTLGLALAMHTHIEMQVRRDDQMQIVIQGMDSDALPQGFRHPTVRAITRLFQHLERAPSGISIFIENGIPLDIGLEARAALIVGGLVAANNLTGGLLGRDDLIQMAIDLGLSSEAAITTMMGGLNICLMDEDGTLMYESLEPPPMRVLLITPELPDYFEQTTNVAPETVSLAEAKFNLSRITFVINALLDGDFDVLHRTMRDRLFQSHYAEFIPGYDEAVQAAYDAGAQVVALAGRGPSLLVLAPYNHALIANAMLEAFQDAGVENCRSWTLGIDTQGVTVSAAE